jgi:hypothetical protein
MEKHGMGFERDVVARKWLAASPVPPDTGAMGVDAMSHRAFGGCRSIAYGSATTPPIG